MDVDAVVRELVAARTGHFLLESGHHGPLWLDLERLFLRPARVRPLAALLGRRLAGHRPEVLCGPLTGGAFVALLAATDMDVAFVPAERTAPVPGRMYSARYTLPASLASAVRGRRVAVVDDVVNAGSAARSTVEAVRAAGGTPVAVAALLRLGDAVAAWAGREELALETLTAWPAQLWEPAHCPRCAAGAALDLPVGVRLLAHEDRGAGEEGAAQR